MINLDFLFNNVKSCQLLESSAACEPELFVHPFTKERSKIKGRQLPIELLIEENIYLNCWGFWCSLSLVLFVQTRTPQLIFFFLLKDKDLAEKGGLFSGF